MTTKEIDDQAWIDYPYTFRNNRGVAKVDGRFIRYGVPEPKGRETDYDLKGGDRIGWCEVEITQDMVGQKIAVFTNIEIKGPGDTLKKGQIDWHNLVIRSGGISKIYCDDDGGIEIVEEIIDEQTRRNKR